MSTEDHIKTKELREHYAELLADIKEIIEEYGIEPISREEMK